MANTVLMSAGIIDGGTHAWKVRKRGTFTESKTYLEIAVEG